MVSTMLNVGHYVMGLAKPAIYTGKIPKIALETLFGILIQLH